MIGGAIPVYNRDQRHSPYPTLRNFPMSGREAERETEKDRDRVIETEREIK